MMAPSPPRGDVACRAESPGGRCVWKGGPLRAISGGPPFVQWEGGPGRSSLAAHCWMESTRSRRGTPAVGGPAPTKERRWGGGRGGVSGGGCLRGQGIFQLWLFPMV